MTRLHAVAATLTIALGVCGCRQTSTARKAADVDASRPAAAAPAPSPNQISISDEMLRDLRITTSTVEQRRGGDTATVLGELGVNENRYAEVGSPIQARIVALAATSGQSVRRGDPLATLESGELAKARSDLMTSDARLQLAQQALARKRTLSDERIVPAREVQEAENEAAAAEAQVRAAVASLGALGVSEHLSDDRNISAFTLHAPVSGVVLDRTAVLGQVADPLKPLFRIADLSTLWLTVHAFERDAVRLHVRTAARITFAAIPGRVFDGSIALMGRSVDPQSRTVPVRIDLPNRDGLLRPGMSASARLPVGDLGAALLTVPAAALQRVRDRWCVFVPKDERTFDIRPVGRGRDLGGEVEIVSGVRGGERIVVEGAFLLKAETERSASEGDHEEHR